MPTPDAPAWTSAHRPLVSPPCTTSASHAVRNTSGIAAASARSTDAGHGEQLALVGGDRARRSTPPASMPITRSPAATTVTRSPDATDDAGELQPGDLRPPADAGRGSRPSAGGRRRGSARWRRSTSTSSGPGTGTGDVLDRQDLRATMGAQHNSLHARQSRTLGE